MAFTLTKDAEVPAAPCGRCGGRAWWKTSKASPFWRCATCQPPAKAYEGRRMPRDLQRATARAE